MGNYQLETTVLLSAYCSKCEHTMGLKISREGDENILLVNPCPCYLDDTEEELDEVLTITQEISDSINKGEITPEAWLRKIYWIQKIVKRLLHQ